MKLYKDKNIEFRLDVGSDILTAKFLNPNPIMYEAAQFTGAIELVHARRVLLDLSLVKEFQREAKEHLIEDLTKQLFGQGVRKLAVLNSPNQEVNEFVRQVLEENLPPKLKYKFFDIHSDAIVWLKNNYSKD